MDNILHTLPVVLIVAFTCAWIGTALLAAGRDTPAGLMFLPGSLAFFPLPLTGLALSYLTRRLDVTTKAGKVANEITSFLLIAPGLVMVWSVYPVTYLTQRYRRHSDGPAMYTEAIDPYTSPELRAYLAEHHLCHITDTTWCADGGITVERDDDGFWLTAPATNRVWDLNELNDADTR